MLQNPSVTIYTDGACSGNPGPGGYACIMVYNDHEKVISGGMDKTTNNRMELTAAIEALKALKCPCNVVLYADSNYVVSGINSWYADWKSRGWRTKAGKAVQNLDLWQEFDRLTATTCTHIEAIKVAGHSGFTYNERCDALACQERDAHRPLSKARFAPY